LRGCIFFISNLFSTIANVSDAPKGGIQVLFEDQKQQSLLLDPARPEHFNVWSPADLPSYLLAKYKPKRKKSDNIYQLHAHLSSQKEEKKNMHLETCSKNNKYMPHVTPLAPSNPQINYSKKSILKFFSPKLKRFTNVLFWAKCCQVVRSQCPILRPL
jgi:hypothetical protein